MAKMLASRRNVELTIFRKSIIFEDDILSCIKDIQK